MRCIFEYILKAGLILTLKSESPPFSPNIRCVETVKNDRNLPKIYAYCVPPITFLYTFLRMNQFECIVRDHYWNVGHVFSFKYQLLLFTTIISTTI